MINPLSEKETKTFDLKVLDKGGNVQYYLPKPIDVTKNVRASPFAYASVTSSSPVVGQSGIYSFSLTLGVNTPAGFGGSML